MARLFRKKQARQEAEAHERATTSEWLEAVMSFTGDAGLIRPLRHAPAHQLAALFSDQDGFGQTASTLVSSGMA